MTDEHQHHHDPTFYRSPADAAAAPPEKLASRLYVFDTQADPSEPKIVQVLGPEELGKRASYSRPHTVHCGGDAASDSYCFPS